MLFRSALENQISPAQGGLDTKRLTHVNAHLERYVDDGRLPGFHVVLARHGKVAYQHLYGMRDIEASLPVAPDTIYRIYSMTKPITSVALMMLVEEGKLLLTDPVSAFIPSFGSARVWRGGSVLKPITEPVTEPMLVWHLLSHTAGLTYGFL